MLLDTGSPSLRARAGLGRCLMGSGATGAGAAGRAVVVRLGVSACLRWRPFEDGGERFRVPRGPPRRGASGAWSRRATRACSSPGRCRSCCCWTWGHHPCAGAAYAGQGVLVGPLGSGSGSGVLAASYEAGHCGRVVGGALPAAGEAVGRAVGGGYAGAVPGEDMQLRVGHAGRPGRDAVVLQDEPVIPGEHGANSERSERVLQFGQQEHPAGDLGRCQDERGGRRWRGFLGHGSCLPSCSFASTAWCAAPGSNRGTPGLVARLVGSASPVTTVCACWPGCWLRAMWRTWPQASFAAARVSLSVTRTTVRGRQLPGNGTSALARWKCQAGLHG